MRIFFDYFDVGHVDEWSLLSGDVIRHKVHDGWVQCLAVGDDRVVTCNSNNVVQVFSISTCLLALP